jgi:DNA adenine methylase
MIASKGGEKATSAGIPSPLKWHVDGGKSYLAARIVAMMPAHTHYVEPYAGGLSVLLAKNPDCVSEVVNDAHRELTNFWRVMQVPHLFTEFIRIEEATPFSEAEYQWASRQPDRIDDAPALAAHAFFIRCRQSLAGRMDSFAPLSRNRTRRGMNEQASAWLSAVEGLPAVHARLKRVVVLNRDALDVIRQQDGPNTLFYLDPPYLKETRAAGEVYEHEMTEYQHVDLCTVIRQCVGKVMLSGYPSELYRFQLDEQGWHRTDFSLPNNSAGGKSKRRMTECVWSNFTQSYSASALHPRQPQTNRDHP